MGKIHRHDVSFPCFFADLLPTSYVCLKSAAKVWVNMDVPKFWFTNVSMIAIGFTESSNGVACHSPN